MDYEKRVQVFEGPNRRLKRETVETVRGFGAPATASSVLVDDEGSWWILVAGLCCVLLLFLFFPLVWWNRDNGCCNNCGGWQNCYYYDGSQCSDGEWCGGGAFSADLPSAESHTCEGRFVAAANKRRAEHRKAAEASWNATREAAQRGAIFSSCEGRRRRDRSEHWRAMRSLIAGGDLSEAVAAMGAARFPLPFSASRNASVLTLRASGRPLCSNEVKCEGTAEFFAAFFRESLLQARNHEDVAAIDEYAARTDGGLGDPAVLSLDEARAAFRSGGLDIVRAFGGGLSHVRFERGARHASVGVFRRFSDDQIRTYMLASFHLFSYSRSRVDCAAVAMLLAESKAKMREECFLDNVLLARRSLFDGRTTKAIAPPRAAARAAGNSTADACALNAGSCPAEMARACNR